MTRPPTVTATDHPGGVTQLRRRAEPDSQVTAPQQLDIERRGWAETLGNLPLQLTCFIGRQEEQAQIRQLLTAARLLTLTGTGGIGKTRLALELAAAVRDAYPDGVWLVELASLAEPMLVSQAVATSLGVRAEAQTPLQNALVDFLRPRQLLLVLDNCEQLVTACAELVEALLRACPGLRILATSREPLRILGERAWRVPALRLPRAPGSAVPEQILNCESVRLFADRASAVAGLALTARDAPAVARLCQRLEGIPLAIELAAGRAGVLSVEQIADRLDDRFRLLVGGSCTAATRQQTLRATIDWSYDLLSAPERNLLCRVSVFAGSWTLEAAEAVCAGDGIGSADILEHLSRLVDKSLVLAEPRASGHARYRLLESVRHYAQDHLREVATAAETVERRHCAYYRELAEHVQMHTLWGAEDVNWCARLDPEQANLRVALGWSLSEAGSADLSLQLAGYLGHFWYTRGDRGEGSAWLRQALARADGSVHCGDETARSTRAWALLWAGGLAHGQSHYDEAVALLEQALDAFNRLNDKRGIGWALSFLGYVARGRADLVQARVFLDQAVAAMRAIGDELSLILPLAALAFTAGALGDEDGASMLLEESVTLAKNTGSSGRLAMVSVYLGQVKYAQGDMPRATAAFTEGLQLSREWGSAWGMAECLEGLSLVAGAMGQGRRAARLLGAAARLRESIGAPVHPVDRADHDQVVASMQAAMGGAAFAAECAAGHEMALNQTIEYAVGSDDAATAPEPAESPIKKIEARLTSREREVTDLIARGLSNRQIAEALVVAQRTASNHVEHILNKLGFHSRSQVAAWATEHRLSAASC